MDRFKQQQSLEKLFNLKKHREDRLTRELAKNQMAIEECDHCIQDLQKQQQAILPQWKAANQRGIQAKRHALADEVNKHYNIFFIQYTEMESKINQKNDEKKELLQMRQQIYHDLNRNRIEQEKIKYIQEKMK